MSIFRNEDSLLKDECLRKGKSEKCKFLIAFMCLRYAGDEIETFGIRGKKTVRVAREIVPRSCRFFFAESRITN